MKSADNTTIFARSLVIVITTRGGRLLFKDGRADAWRSEVEEFIIHSIERDGDRETGITSELSSAIDRRRGFQRRASSPFFWCLGADAWLNIHFHISRYVSNVKRRPRAHWQGKERKDEVDERGREGGRVKRIEESPRWKRRTGTSGN